MKVLIVDDEALLAKALARAFEKKNHQVITCFGGEEGLDAWNTEDPDIVLLDVVMPGLTGPQVIEARRKVEKNIRAKVVLMSAHSGVKGKAMAVDLGADEFISKPFENVFELIESIEKL